MTDECEKRRTKTERKRGIRMRRVTRDMEECGGQVKSKAKDKRDKRTLNTESRVEGSRVGVGKRTRVRWSSKRKKRR